MQGTPPDDSFESKLIERLTDLSERVEDIENLDVQSQINRLNERIKSLEEGQIRFHRSFIRTVMTTHTNTVLDWLRRTGIAEDDKTQAAIDCSALINHRYISAKARLEYTNDPQKDYDTYHAAINEFLSRYDFHPFLEE